MDSLHRGRKSAARSVRNDQIFWQLMKRKHPMRVSSKDFQDALAGDGIHVVLRSIQRYLVAFEDNGLIYSDNTSPAGWRLTKLGCEFLGVQSRTDTPIGSSIYPDIEE